MNVPSGLSGVWPGKCDHDTEEEKWGEVRRTQGREKVERKKKKKNIRISNLFKWTLDAKSVFCSLTLPD